MQNHVFTEFYVCCNHLHAGGHNDCVKLLLAAICALPVGKAPSASPEKDEQAEEDAKALSGTSCLRFFA